MENIDATTITEGLEELGLSGEELEETLQIFIELRQELAESILEMEEKGLPAALAIANTPQAIQIVDMLTDYIVENQGILERAMQGEDIHDTLAVIKAKIESLIVGDDIEAQTLSHITQRMLKFKKSSHKKSQDSLV